MAKKIIKAQMKQRRDTLENWAAANPVLLDGELGFIEGFNDRFKVGDGKTAWNDLSYFSGSFNPSGTYPDLTAGDLAGRGESVPASFGFRASGGKSIKDGRAYIKRIKGNSVVWNQMNESPDFSMLNSFNAVGGASHTSANGVLSVTLGASNYSGVVDVSIYWKIQVNHTYLFITRAKANTTLNNVAIPYISSYGISPKNTLTTSYQTFAKIFKVTANSTTSGPCRAGEVGTDFNAGDVIDVNMYCVIDLTKMFGAGNEPTTIEEFYARKPIVEDEYAYNEGQVIHCNTESIKSVGDNAWDEQWENGFIYGEGEVSNDATSGIISKNFIPVLANEEYYYVYPQGAQFLSIAYYDHSEHYISQDYLYASNVRRTPTNAAYIKFFAEGVPTYNHDILISLYHSGWKAQKDEQYQPYWQDTLPLPIIRKYFPQGMKLAGSAHDEIRYNKAGGKWEYSKGKIKSVDLGTLNWSEFSEVKGIWFSYDVASLAAYTSNNGKPSNILCGKYTNKEWFSDKGLYQTIDGICIDMYGCLYLGDSSYTDAAALKASLQGVILYYESKDWEWVELDAEDQNFRDYYKVADFGTEMSQSNVVPSAAFSADIIYQFNAVDMIREHEMEINELQSIIATMQAQLASLIQN